MPPQRGVSLVASSVLTPKMMAGGQKVTEWVISDVKRSRGPCTEVNGNVWEKPLSCSGIIQADNDRNNDDFLPHLFHSQKDLECLSPPLSIYFPTMEKSEWRSSAGKVC